MAAEFPNPETENPPGGCRAGFQDVSPSKEPNRAKEARSICEKYTQAA